MATNLDRLEEKRRQLDEQIKKAKAKEAKKDRDEKHRRQLLYGEAFYAAIESGDVSRNLLDQVLDKYIARAADRQFLELAPKADDEAAGES